MDEKRSQQKKRVRKFKECVRRSLLIYIHYLLFMSIVPKIIISTKLKKYNVHNVKHKNH